MRTRLLLFPGLALMFACARPEPPAKPLGKPVNYLGFTPQLDGVLDPSLAVLPSRQFGYFSQFDNPPTDTIAVSYRLAYNEDYLYFYIEAAADSVTYRERGFTAGDGAKLLVGLPKDSLTDEFYELVFSPSRKPDYWERKRLWTYNIETVLRDLSPDSDFATHAAPGRTGFEFLISWRDVKPYHPWFTPAIGLNAYFAKGIGDTITNGYGMHADEGFWDEGVKRRAVEQAFELPQKTDRLRLQSQLTRNHSQAGEPVTLAVASIAPRATTTPLLVQIKNAAGQPVRQQSASITSTPRFARLNLALDLKKLPPGPYTVTTQLGEGGKPSSAPLTIFPAVDWPAAKQTLARNPPPALQGARSSLAFAFQDVTNKLNRLKPYDSGEALYQQQQQFQQRLKVYQQGRDPYAGLRHNHRRAFRSILDGTYQPYSLKLPADYNPATKYPLLVVLHGSGVSEENMLNQAWSDGSFIELAPLGRDIYGCYDSKAAQADIREAIADVVRYFAVDESKIIISGFSMGGYGALRTYYEQPKLFKGVAVFSGHPDLLNFWQDTSAYPNFLDDRYLARFRNMPVFIFHGKKDGIPYALMEKTAAKLRQHGARVELSLASEKGHEYPDPRTFQRYVAWLGKLTGK